MSAWLLWMLAVVGSLTILGVLAYAVIVALPNWMDRRFYKRVWELEMEQVRKDLALMGEYPRPKQPK